MGCRKPKHERITYESRYRHKLNMLWPGQTMLKIVGVFLLMGLLFRFLKWRGFASGAFVPTAVVFAVLTAAQLAATNGILLKKRKESESVPEDMQ